MTAISMKTLELLYPVIQILINLVNLIMDEEIMILVTLPSFTYIVRYSAGRWRHSN